MEIRYPCQTVRALSHSRDSPAGSRGILVGQGTNRLLSETRRLLAESCLRFIEISGRTAQSWLPLQSSSKLTMKTLALTSMGALLCALIHAQDASIAARLSDADGAPVVYSNVALHRAADTALIKVEVTDDMGQVTFRALSAGDYLIKATYVGFADLLIPDLTLGEGQALDLGEQRFVSSGIDLQTATVTATRAIVEIKPDRTVFNVQGTINSAGQNAIELLRKAPGVLVDNNDNISVLSRSGVLVYVDGKRLPLSGEDLTNYLQNLPAEQIDRMDIITSPSAKYEAEGNAGIIDIRLKKDKNMGANGTVSTNVSQGFYARGNLNTSGNFRSKSLNVYGNAGIRSARQYHQMDFLSWQNNLQLEEYNRFRFANDGYDYRLGTDLFLTDHHTLGFVVGGRETFSDRKTINRLLISQAATPTSIDSMLVANTTADAGRVQGTYNINYRYEKDGQTLNIDADYGRFRNESYRYQPNQYFDPSGELLLTEIINTFDTPRDIDIYTFKVDYESKVGKGTLALGGKLSMVHTDNTFLFFDQIAGTDIRNDIKSNRFVYDENVYAGYANFTTPLGEKWNLSLGLRAEHTDATGDLQAFLPELQEEPVHFNYLSWFPSGGLTYQVSEKNTLSLNYGRRINRPDYNVLNPFRNQLSELSFEKGNAFLRPEIVNNLELGYTINYRYNVKFGYSYTTDQITRLIGPADFDDRANFITWDNLATQSIYSLNVSAPIQVTKGWNTYLNVSGSHLDNQADYGGNAIVDVQAWTYNIFQQTTIDLPKGFQGEVSGWFAGPGVWGGVFRYETQWSLNLGLQKKFLQNKLNAKLSFQDIFYESGWSGYSEFNGLLSEGGGRWDSRRVSLSLSYNFGNQNVKSRKRKTGLEEESKRVGS